MARNLGQVGAIDAGRRDLKQHFARPRHGLGGFRDRRDVLASKLLHVEELHRRKISRAAGVRKRLDSPRMPGFALLLLLLSSSAAATSATSS